MYVRPLVDTVKPFFGNMQDEGQAGVPDELLTVVGALLQMLLRPGASHSCHLLASQTPVSIQDHAWRPMRQHLHSNEQLDGLPDGRFYSRHTQQHPITRSSVGCVAGGLARIHA